MRTSFASKELHRPARPARSGGHGEQRGLPTGHPVLDNVRVPMDSDEQFVARVGLSLLSARSFYDDGRPEHARLALIVLEGLLHE